MKNLQGAAHAVLSVGKDIFYHHGLLVGKTSGVFPGIFYKITTPKRISSQRRFGSVY
jgi:hypothetical protein